MGIARIAEIVYSVLSVQLARFMPSLRFLRRVVVILRSCAVFVLFTLLMALVTNPSLSLAQETCLSPSVGPLSQKERCLAECEAFYQKHPETRPSDKRTVCQQTSEQLLSAFHPLRNAERVHACFKGVLDGVMSFPDQVKSYWDWLKKTGAEAKERIESRHEEIRQCQVNLDCKLKLAKQLDRFKDLPITDSKLKDYAANQHALHLLQEIERQNRLKQQNCNQKLFSARETKIRELMKQAVPYTIEIQNQILSRIHAENPECKEYLPLQVSRVTEKKSTEPSWLESLGIKWRCYSHEQVAELLCLEAASLVMDPLNLAVGGGLYLRALKVAKLRPATAGSEPLPRVASDPPGGPKAVDGVHEVRSAEPPTTGVTSRGVNVRYASRSEFVSAHLSKVATTPEQNRRWIQLANSPEGKNYFFVDIENSKLKWMNDTWKDKDFATAVTNRYQNLLLQNLEEFQKKYPGIEIHPYSDFKSVRLAIKGPLNPEMTKDLERVFLKSNQDLSQELRDSQLIRARGIERPQDEPELWFRAGLGDTADHANMAARYSRIHPQASLQSFNDPQLHQTLSSTLNEVKSLHQDLAQNPKLSSLRELSQTRSIPSFRSEFYDLARKSSSPEELQAKLKRYHAVDLSLDEAREAKKYTDAVDRFSASLHLEKRQIPTVEGAKEGALSLDFAGLGGENLKHTADGLFKSQNLEEAIKQSRLAEQRVTQIFETRKKERTQIISNYLSDKKGLKDLKIQCSGDDCIAIFPSRISLKDQRELIQRLSRTDQPAGVRVSFVGDKVSSPTDRALLANHGETLEKYTREALQSQIDSEKLRRITLGVVMQGDKAGQGPVRLLIGNSQVKLTPDELARLEQAFQQATQKLNHDLTRQSKTGLYQAFDLEP